jgi:hypothetical protein
MHKRRAILEDLRTQLKTLSGYGGVWIQRSGPDRTAYPAITLFAVAEDVETLTIHGSPRAQKRDLKISIIAWIRSTQDEEKIETDFDNAAIDIEQKLRKPSMAYDFLLIGTDFSYVEDDMEINAVTLTYQVPYTTDEFNPI